MSYIDTRSEKLRVLHSIYSQDISDYIVSLSDISILNRINRVSKNRGIERSLFNIFPFDYSRLDHSFGVACILEHFKQDTLSVTMGVLHEAHKPGFSFSVDYLIEYFKLKDYEKKTLFDVLVNSKSYLDNALSRDISIADLVNYKKYKLGFATFPRLSAETLEFVLTNAFLTNLCEDREIFELYNNISICKNEDGDDEFCFSDISLATKFFRISLEVGRKRRSYEAKITEQLIADVLMLMIRREEISIDDLYKYSDDELIALGKSSTDRRIQEGWQQVENLCKVFTKFTPTNDRSKYCVKVEDRSIYIDPLVKTKMGNFRLSNISENIEREIKTYLETDTDMYMYIDYEL